MITTTYKCDRCGHEQQSDASPRQLWQIGIRFVTMPSSLRGYDGRCGEDQLWCRNCLETIGAVPRVNSAAPIPAPPSFEDLIRELVREVVREEKP